MVKCKNCGTEYEGNFCSNCGMSATVTVPKTKKSVWVFKKIMGSIVCVIMLVVGIYLMVHAIIGIVGDDNSTDITSISFFEEDKQKGESKINYANFEKIENGMTYEQVVGIFGEEGKILSSVDIGEDEYATTMYYWYDDTGVAKCNVTIQGGKVIAKVQIGLK